MKQKDEEYISKKVEEILHHVMTKTNVWKSTHKSNYGGRDSHREIMKRVRETLKLFSIQFEIRPDKIRSTDFPPLNSPQPNLYGNKVTGVVIDDLATYSWRSNTQPKIPRWQRRLRRISPVA
jgi:hypothetical protein